MSLTLHCPTCGESFVDEDYCPVHGLRLVVELGSDAAAEAAADEVPLAGADAVDDQASADSIEPDPVAEFADHATRGSAATEVPEAEARTRDGRLADFMSRMGLRRPGGRQGPAFEQATPPPPRSDHEASHLPRELVTQGWSIVGVAEPHPGFDRWAVEQADTDGTRTQGNYHRFRTGALTPDALYRRLGGETVSCLPHVHGHGTVDLTGARADYEVVSSRVTGQELDRWLAQSTPSEQRARHLLPLLAELVGALDGAELCALALDPSQLLVDANGALHLTCAASLGERAQMDIYRPELERSALLPSAWSAPEITQQGLPSGNSMVFSVGQVLSVALWGQPCSLADVQRGAVPFKSIADARLARVLMGCLWPRPDERWTPRALSQALDGSSPMPEAEPWESLTPGAAGTAFSFAGGAHWRLESLLDAAVDPSRWSEAITRLDAILTWAEGTAWVGQVALLREALASGRSRDWVLVALARAVRPDAPLTWRGLDLCEAQAARSLVGLAQGALQGNSAEIAALRDLFQADLRGAWSPIPHQN